MMNLLSNIKLINTSSNKVRCQLTTTQKNKNVIRFYYAYKLSAMPWQLLDCNVLTISKVLRDQIETIAKHHGGERCISL